MVMGADKGNAPSTSLTTHVDVPNHQDTQTQLSLNAQDSFTSQMFSRFSHRPQL
ncbi:hypothetical protein KIN20_005800 [Parelaphostrongylus tenuis]|uniref:Uncharacterized protein n=1 Tax=Parelaphostrongylus tenuis TaxID=148309 RepID=A0AAD5MLM1_PARTN|nr:hypothetical protein KIN20_005800 [Parelaphostrongylus tenuis]